MLIKIGDCWVDPLEITAISECQDPTVFVNPLLWVRLRNGSSFPIHAAMDEVEAA